MRRRSPSTPGGGAAGARELALLMAGVSVWSLCYGFEFLFTALDAKLFWVSVRYAGVVTVPVAWVLFALRYTGRGRWISGRNLALLVIVPVVMLALVWTNWAHHLFWLRAATDPSKTFLLVEQGAWFWVFFAYSYLLVALGAFFLVSMLVLRDVTELEHFAYLIAHDLRAPLRGINGFSNILLEDHAAQLDALDAEGREYLTRVADAARTTRREYSRVAVPSPHRDRRRSWYTCCLGETNAGFGREG